MENFKLTTFTPLQRNSAEYSTWSSRKCRAWRLRYDYR